MQNYILTDRCCRRQSINKLIQLSLSSSTVQNIKWLFMPIYHIPFSKITKYGVFGDMMTMMIAFITAC